MSKHLFNELERRAVFVLAGAYAFRMVGLYLVLPVLSLHASELGEATPILIGLAVGSYGFTQMFLQIPFGMMSDHFGRKPALVLGLFLFALGSVIAGLATNVWALVLGRCLQGSGAIASAIIATLADQTRSEVRTQAMAVVGLSVGLAFAGGFIFGPPLAENMGVPFIFYMTATGAILAIPLLEFGLPEGKEPIHHQEVEASWSQLGGVLRNKDLLRIDMGIFLLHFALTGLLVVLPFVFDQYMGKGHLWRIYAPILVGGLLLMFVVAQSADRFTHSSFAVYAGASSITLGFLVLLIFGRGLSPSIVGLALFVVGIAILEPLLPAILSRHAPAASRGTAAGAFSMSEFLGSFLGGLAGGLSLETGHGTFYGIVVVAMIGWMLLMRGLPLAPKDALEETG